MTAEVSCNCLAGNEILKGGNIIIYDLCGNDAIAIDHLRGQTQ